MSIQAILEVLRNAPFSGNNLLVLIAMAERANQDGGSIWASLDDIAKTARVSRQTARRAISKIVESGWLELVDKSTQHRPNVYRIPFVTSRGIKTDLQGYQIEPPGVSNRTCEQDESVSRGTKTGLQRYQNGPPEVPQLWYPKRINVETYKPYSPLNPLNQESTSETVIKNSPPGDPVARDKAREKKLIEAQKSILFAEFWAEYPKKADKAKAIIAWGKAVGGDLDLAKEIIADAKSRRQRHRPWVEAIATKDYRFVKLPTTHLNGKNWEDDFDEGVANGTGGGCNSAINEVHNATKEWLANQACEHHEIVDARHDHGCTMGEYGGYVRGDMEK